MATKVPQLFTLLKWKFFEKNNKIFKLLTVYFDLVIENLNDILRKKIIFGNKVLNFGTKTVLWKKVLEIKNLWK